MAPTKDNVKNHHVQMTRERILDEAESLFARKGYHAVSVREITDTAGCNLAAVNYHFRNKKNLYVEVFRSRWMPRANRVHACFRKSLNDGNAQSPTAVVRHLVQAFLDGPLNDEERRRHHQLISGEMAQPTAAFAIVMDEVLRPLFEDLMEDLRPVMSPDVQEEQFFLNTFTIMTMIMYFNYARPLIAGISGCEYNQDKSRLIDHIVEFTINGMGIHAKESSR